MKRSGKFYRKNEAEVMEQLGLKPTVNSGSGWIEKEDGQNDYVICQLKSTDKNSISVRKYDIDTLLYNASVSHKIPVFAIQFIQSNEVYLLVKPDDLCSISEYLISGSTKGIDFGLDLIEEENKEKKAVAKVKSSKRAREEFAEANNRKYKKEGKSAL